MQNKGLRNGFALSVSLLLLPIFLSAQVNTVEFGKNRIQYKKFSWKFYQSPNFNIYYNEGGLELAKFVVQLAEEELDSIENEVDYSLQRRATIVIYNNYDDYKTSNIGLGIDWQNAGGLTTLVNNKIPLYFDGNHNTFRLKVRQAIARILTDNILFGASVGEFASNQALLDLPKWLTDGYVDYVAEHWSIERDDELKNVILSGDYNNFYQFAFDKPLLAGHAFWYYIARKYKPQNVTYFLYLARLYKSLNAASTRIAKKKFKYVLADFMEEEQQRYVEDIKQRRNAPRGKLAVVEDLYKSDFYHFAANPNPKNNSYAVVQFTKGKYRVKYFNNFYEEKTLLDYGVRTIVGDMNPNMPILAWDGKGSRLLCIYTKEGKTYMFVYDVIANIKRFQQEIEGFNQVLDAGFIFDANTLLLSAVNNGHSDIYTYRIDNGKIKQITNDVYDDLDPTFVAFPGRLGIIFASNRPGINAPNTDTVLPSRNHFNIFLADINNNSEFRQITQLTNMKYGDARYPMQYNQNHFTFVSDENGINNRWAGFFTTQTGGLDTLYYIGDDVLRNPDAKEMDSALHAWQKAGPDSISYFKVYQDSTYTFPITNYQSSLQETKVAGNNDQVSEVRQEGEYKFLYKLRVDSIALRKRNINARPTDYIRRMITAEKLAGAANVQVEEAPQPENKNQFQNEFEDEKKDSSATGKADAASGEPVVPRINYLEKSKLFDYRKKFEADYVLAGVTNNILINRYQPYGGYDQTGPIYLNNSDAVSFTFRVGVSDIMEDVKLIGGIRLGTSLTDKDVFVSYQNYRRRIDWGLTYYRSNVTNYNGFFKGTDSSGLDRNYIDNMVITNIYQANVSYPFDETKRLAMTVGLRKDIGILRPLYLGSYSYPDALKEKDSVSNTVQARLEYVYDNTINPTENIWNGLRWKIYTEFFLPANKSSETMKTVMNIGFDARNYVKIYRNFIWAVRGAGDFSLGQSKLIYYLGGADGWVFPKFNEKNTADPTVNYAFQTLALNLRGFEQNVANGSNNLVLNSELRLPVFSTFFNSPINNAFLRNFQLVQFIDLGTAWSGGLSNIKRPTMIYEGESMEFQGTSPLTVRVKAGGIGPFAGGYGFGARSTLLGYFLRADVAWEMRGIFRGSPMFYFSLGFDF
ncbi:hypothetical protein [Parafilimonas sp.]|uniref:hypothetical protein n=1 Tax=Parafilimonas sp. TaxID=1969739 RepID=UPI0039E3AAFE